MKSSTACVLPWGQMERDGTLDKNQAGLCPFRVRSPCKRAIKLAKLTTHPDLPNAAKGLRFFQSAFLRIQYW